ncbi:Dynein light chain [Aphelenchoides besseyi]|nr:Dynein light chain [Aphelenchoides besseyi]
MSESRSNHESDLKSLRFQTRSKVVVKAAEVPEDMIRRAVGLADEAIANNLNEADIAQFLKSNFDKLYPAPWHCFVGKRFSSFVTHESGSFIYFYIVNLAVVLFRCKD